MLKCATWWLFRGVPTLCDLASRRGLHAEQHACLCSVFVHSYLSNWTLLAVFPCGPRSQDKQSQSQGARWLLETPGLVPPNLLEPSSMSVHWTVLTRIPSTEAICPCVGLMMLGHDTGFSTFTGHLVFLFPQKYPCYTYGCQNVPIKKQTPMKHPDLFTQKQNPHETPGLIHSPAPVVGTQQHQSVKTMWLWKWLMSAWRLLIKRRRDDEVGRRMS